MKNKLFRATALLLLFVMLLPMIAGCTANGDYYPPFTRPPRTKETISTEPDTSEPEITEPETSEPETTEPETSDSVTTVPETSEPVSSTPETSEPKTSEPETTQPKTTEPQTAAPIVNPPSTDEIKEAYLSVGGLSEVSRGKNIIVFILDRFDITFYDSAVKSNPKFFNNLKGFTFFEDYISMYSRTYPSVCQMITGIDQTWSMKRADYFKTAYQTSPFLKDLKANDYRIKIYTDSYYVYTSGEELYGVADNLSVNYAADEQPMKYELDDATTFRLLHENGLTFDDSANSYMFLHLRGLHDPYTMDKNGNPTDSGSSSGAIAGCFKLIYDYIDELRRLGVYKDSTIIITGDHPRARDDTADPTQPRMTTLFVKPAGTEDEPLQTSSAQVSQLNFIPTLVESASLNTTANYGTSFFKVNPSKNYYRFHKFELSANGTNYIVTWRVSGPGRDFSNWTVSSRVDIGSLYK